MARDDELLAPQGNELKEEIDRRFETGRFVAVEAQRVVADAESHSKLVEKLQALGKSPQGLLVVQAGVEYPDSAVILLNRHVIPRHA
jgi:hypothetical protein